MSERTPETTDPNAIGIDPTVKATGGRAIGYPRHPDIPGDWTDDDATIMDAQIGTSNAPGDERVAIGPTIDTDQPIKRTGRIMSGFQVFGVANAGDQPQQILPPDPRRKSFVIQLVSATATDWIGITDEVNKLQSSAGALALSGIFGRLYAANPIGPIDYTGPVSIQPGGVTAAVTVSWWAFTE
jgi:hypothetical protein